MKLSTTIVEDSDYTSPAARALERRAKITWLLVVSIPVVFLIVLYAYPILRLLSLSLFDPEFTTKHYIRFFKLPAYLKIMGNTFKMSFSVTALCLFLGYPVAYLLTMSTPRVRNLLMIMVVLPFFTAILVRTYAWMVILGRNGVLNSVLMDLGLISNPLKLMHNMLGVHVGMVQILLPFMILPLYSVMVNIDRDLMRAAENLAANPFRVFIHIFLPLSLPGVGGGCLLVFILALGFYITPALLGGLSDVMIAMFIETQVNDLVNWGFGAAMGVILLAITLMIFPFYNRMLSLDKVLDR